VWLVVGLIFCVLRLGSRGRHDCDNSNGLIDAVRRE